MTDFILEILKLSVPALIVFITVDSVLRRHFLNESMKRSEHGVEEKRKSLLPIQLQAYERLMLYLERMAPEHLFPRLHEPGVPVGALHMQIIASIQQEFEHNLSQKLYVSDQAWKTTIQAKEDMTAMYQAAYKKMPQTGGISEYIQEVQNIIDEFGVHPTQFASVVLKDELNKLFR
jgi:hypothetical protein